MNKLLIVILLIGLCFEVAWAVDRFKIQEQEINSYFSYLDEVIKIK